MTDARPRLLLAIESSCDETAAAVVRGREVLSSIVASQAGLHDRFGGVVPEIASRRHLECIDGVVHAALVEAGIDPASGGPGRAPGGIEAVAVTRGPGLVGALLVGVAAARSRAWAWGVPLVPVDHLLGHVASALLADPTLEPPFLCLLASGGHTMVLDVREGLELDLLGSTRDDAAGEAFDKGARLLGLGMPGGPAIERAAAEGDPAAIAFTPAMAHRSDTLDTSFAGLKTALAVATRRYAAAHPDGELPVSDLAASYQHAIVETLSALVVRLLARRGPSGTAEPSLRRDRLALVGGVAANSRLRSRIDEACRETGVDVTVAPLRYCGDNAAMIGVAAAWSRQAESTAASHVDAIASSPLFRRRELLPNEPVG